MHYLKSFWKLWLRIAKPIGNFQARILFTLFYFILLLPVGTVLRLFGDPLQINKASYIRKKTAFLAWEHPKEDLDQARKPY